MFSALMAMILLHFGFYAPTIAIYIQWGAPERTVTSQSAYKTM